MNKVLILLMSIVLVSCSTAPTVGVITPNNIGDDVQRHLVSRYSDTSVDCGRPTTPAFICNGIVLRGTNYSPSYHSWDNSPSSHTNGGVSFSYLRKDANFFLAFTNGYIFLPYEHATGKLHPEILCSFPINANTVNRANNGCGQSGSITNSGPCQTQGVTTATQWYTHYLANGASGSGQCGFDVQSSLDAEATAGFNATLQAMSLVTPSGARSHNELRVKVWPDGSGAQLPLEAFFYISTSSAGLAAAKNDQLDLKNTAGVSIPVIAITLPSTVSGTASFLYSAADQAVQLP